MALSDNLQLISYLAAAETYNQGRNMFDCFQPIVESTLMCKIDSDRISFLALQNKLNEIYHLSIPKATLRQLLDNLQLQGKIIFENKRTVFLCRDKLSESFWQKRADRESAIEDFFLEFSAFLSDRNIEISLLEIKEECCKWVYAHSLELAEFISNITKEKLQGIPAESQWKYADYLILFLLEIQNRKTDSYITFLLIYNGAVQASLLNFEPSGIDSISNSEINVSNLILDTNFILRILNLQSEFDVSVATDTLNSLKAEHSRFYVLQQTINEIQTSINKFLFDIQPYSTHTSYLRQSRIRMSGFWDAYRRGLTRAKFLELTNTNNLKNAIAQILDVTFIDDFDESSISTDQINQLITSKSRDGYSEKSARHDLSLIQYCREKRKKRLITVADVDWWVVTNDERLSYWNQFNCGEYQECLTEIQLSNLMWVQKKRENNNGLMQTVLSLSNNTAITPQGVAKFSSSVSTYQKTNSENAEKLDNLSLVFASNALTAEDINRINREENSLDQVIEEKVLEIQLEQKQQHKRFQDATAEGERLSTQNDLLSKKVESITLCLEVEKLERQNDKLNRDIVDSIKEQISKEENLKSFKTLNDYADSHEKSTARVLCLFIWIPILLIIGIQIKWGYAFTAMILQKATAIPDLIQNILCSLLIPSVLTAIYYTCVVFIFAAPKSPKEIFLFLKSKLLSFRTRQYAKKVGIAVIPNSTNISDDIKAIEQEISSINRQVEIWKASVERNKGKIELLKQPVGNYV